MRIFCETDREYREGALLWRERAMFRRPGSGLARRGGGRIVGASAFGAASSAVQLPTVAVYLSQFGVTQAGTVTAWAPSRGGWAAGTLIPGVAPAYSATSGVGGLPRIDFDGTDDYLTVTPTAGAAWGGIEMGIVGNVASDGATADAVITANGAAAGEIRRIEEAAGDITTGTLRYVQSTAAASATSTYTTTKVSIRHHSADWTQGGNQNARVGGTAEDSDANDDGTYLDARPISVGARPDGAAPSAIQIQACYWSYRQLTTAERAYLRALLTALTGVAS